MPFTLITADLVETLWPKHDRTSCSDANPSNGYPHHDNGAPRCNRCMGLEHIGFNITDFVIEASIRRPPDPEETRKKALAKLTVEERRVLGI
jgi:hypothetical protein